MGQKIGEICEYKNGRMLYNRFIKDFHYYGDLKVVRSAQYTV